MVSGNVVLNATPESLQQGIDLIDFGSQLKAEAYTTARLLAFDIDACPIVSSTPGTGRLGSVTLDLAGLAELASGGTGQLWVGVKPSLSN